MSGETGQIGALAVSHVGEVSKQKVDQLSQNLNMVAMLVLVTVRRVSNATPKHAVSQETKSLSNTFTEFDCFKLSFHISSQLSN